jgi:hypothetical protein
MPNPADGFSVDVYNKLPELEDATKKLARVKADFDEFVREASRLLADADFGDGQIGAFLLHRHWKLDAGTMMVERPRILESGKIALVTSAVAATSTRGMGLRPCRWAAPSVEQAVVGLEFSPDPFVIEINEALTKRRGLLKSLAKLVGARNLQGTIGYMVIPRKSLTSQRFPDFVETNQGGLSVVTGERLSAKEKLTSIMTGWPLSTSRRGSVFACCYCSHPGGGTSCRHPKPDPPICKPHGCV